MKSPGVFNLYGPQKALTKSKNIYRVFKFIKRVIWTYLIIFSVKVKSRFTILSYHILKNSTKIHVCVCRDDFTFSLLHLEKNNLVKIQ